MLAPGLCLHNLLFDLELHEFLGFDFHVLLHGCVRSLKLHCLLISDHHLQLYFLLMVFLFCSLITLQFQCLLLLFGVMHDVLAPIEKLTLTASSSVAFCSYSFYSSGLHWPPFTPQATTISAQGSSAPFPFFPWRHSFCHPV